MTKSELKPACVFEEFAKINKIPRPSKHEEKMIAFLKAQGEEMGLETIVDETGNVVIRKPATPAMENKPGVILQSHMDMVCESLKGKDIDFENDPIETVIDGEWMTADRTTLGADDGIGCAMELALLRSTDIEHGPIECVFTRDEETGLTGAMGMKAGFMNGDYLINLDSEDEGQFFISCAGGVNTKGIFKYVREEAPQGMFFMEAKLHGFVGGHSGDDINKKHANVIKIMARFLMDEMQKGDLRLCSWDAGKAHNAIPREGVMTFAVPFSRKEEVKADWNIFAAEVAEEFHATEGKQEMTLGSTDAAPVLSAADTRRIILCMHAMHNGILTMCQDEDLAWLVETSSNLASIHTSDTDCEIVTSQRSCVMSQRHNMSQTIRAAFELAGAEVDQGDGYPAWQPRQNSHLVDITAQTYRKLFNREPQIIGIHAGLECGLFAERYPNLDMVSLGPTLRGVHTPDEKLLIPTVQMVWDHLKEILKSI